MGVSVDGCYGLCRAGQGRERDRWRIATTASQPRMRTTTGGRQNEQRTKEPKNQRTKEGDLRFFGSSNLRFFDFSSSVHAFEGALKVAAELPRHARASAWLPQRDTPTRCGCN